MSDFKLNQIEILPEQPKDPIYDERTDEKAHTAYEAELLFFSCIKQGSEERLLKTMNMFFSNGLVIGKLSSNNLRQMQYWAVSCITLAVRYAIEGGLDETEAYNLSDKIIMQLDAFQNPDQIPPFLQEKAIQLTRLVNSVMHHKNYPSSVRKCISYIKQNLNKRLTLKELSSVCSLSPDYLSSLFKKTTGTKISNFILNEKLEASKILLNGKYDYSDISYYLSFCSESYFISCFKKAYKMTPREYVKSLNY